MVQKEFGKKCQECGSIGEETHARMFYRPINEKWKRICKKCWEFESTNASLQLFFEIQNRDPIQIKSEADKHYNELKEAAKISLE